MVTITVWKGQADGWFPKLGDDARAKWAAAEDYVASRTTWAGADAVPPTPAPAGLVEAVRLMTARLLQRANSPEGVIGMDPDGFGAVRVPKVDVDVQALMAPYQRVVFA